uniref:Vacuolar protein sorting-associated protein 33A n=1 Tax=Felis catus TaxID=9685 RepID=A0ABI8AHF8_FELCA
MAAHLSYGRVNLNVLREAVRRELREFLDKCAGSKAIVWDEYLTGPFGLIAQYSLLKEHEVEKMFTLKGSRLPAADVKNIIFFVRPRLELMDIIAENVLSEDKRGPARDFHILFVPRRSLLCEQRLKDLGVLGSFIHREEYSLDLIPFDGDLLSMESEGAFKTYGYEHILTLYNLEKAGLLKPQTGGRNNYPTIRKTLRLWMDDVNEQNPTDISYVYSGYAPLSVRLAQLLSRPGWRSIEEVLRILPGPHFEERQPLPTGLQKKRQPGENRVTLIFFLGGVTFAEIAALRFLSQLEDGGTEYVIATTKLMNGASWIESLMEKPF